MDMSFFQLKGEGLKEKMPPRVGEPNAEAYNDTKIGNLIGESVEKVVADYTD
jgi:hypothetical protein